MKKKDLAHLVRMLGVCVCGAAMSFPKKSELGENFIYGSFQNRWHPEKTLMLLEGGEMEDWGGYGYKSRDNFFSFYPFF